MSEQKTSFTTNCISTSFESLTIQGYISILKEYLENVSVSPSIKQQLYRSIELGLAEMKYLNIQPEQTLKEVQDYYPTGIRGPFQRDHIFLMNFYPDVVSINVLFPTYKINITHENKTSDITQVLEIFVKLVPLFDSVQTQNRIFIRKLYQKTSPIWPAIGGRILDNDTTVFILAFGLKIDWKMRFF
ncbi:MAG: hypothetical protein QXX20_02950 [Candidatus Thermoplasmatota archaeon]